MPGFLRVKGLSAVMAMALFVCGAGGVLAQPRCGDEGVGGVVGDGGGRGVRGKRRAGQVV